MSKPLNILIVSQYFYPENFRINDFASALVEKGHKVTVLTGKPNYPKGEFFDGYKFGGVQTEIYEGVRVIRVPLISRGNGRGIRLALNYISFVFFGIFFGIPQIKKEKFDFVFAHQLSPVTICLPAIVVKWIKKIPLYMWVQDLWPESLQATGTVRSQKVIDAVGLLVNFIYRQCNYIFVQSKGFIDAISKRGIRREKIIFMPNWAENIFSAIQNENRNIPVLSGEFKILFAGNIGEAQDFPTILKAAERLKSDSRIQWYVLGDGRKKEWVANEIQKLGLTNVHLLGQYPLETMPGFFKQADALLVSLKREPIFALTIPSKIQSYLAVGKPILASMDGEGARVVQEANAGLTCPAEMPEELSKKIINMISKNVEERSGMGRSGQQYFSKNFERDLVISGFENKVYELLSQ